MKLWSGVPTKALALVATAAILGAEGAEAQLGNGGSSIGGSGATIASAPRPSVSSSGPTGVGRSRMPLTTPEVMPYENTKGLLDASQTAGMSSDDGLDSQAYGSSSQKWPYTTARVAITGAPFAGATNGGQIPVTHRPYRYMGKLWMRFGSDWYVCSAALIKKGILVTAAHCVHNYGEGNPGFADEVRWYPANWAAGGGPWGYFQGVTWRVPAPYVNGTDTCQSGAIGVVCNNDIATVTLAPRNGNYAGNILGGWMAYGWNGYGFIASPAFGGHTLAAVTQFGYPVAIDNGYQMLRNDSFGKYIQSTGANAKVLKNTQLGSAMTGGSSGGPWMVNFGTRPVVTGNASLGSASNSNVIIGVTSWGYTTVGVNVQGASYFGQNAEFPNAAYGSYGAGNIGKLVQDTCTASPGYC